MSEKERLAVSAKKNPWKKWGPYLSERQWGTVREDYSLDGDAWEYFTHDQARSRAYRWGEDGLAGISDRKQILCFSWGFWNEQDAILKERLFGLTNSEGNHGEDVKECYFYLDNTPTHAYMKYLYKYPQKAYPYEDLIQQAKNRTESCGEYELLDTGVFSENRYFDLIIEYAKGGMEDLCIKLTAYNRGKEPAVLHVLPTLLFRNTWTWSPGTLRPQLKGLSFSNGYNGIEVMSEHLGTYRFYVEQTAPILFTDNETNNERLFGTPNPWPFVKDGIHEFIITNNQSAVNPKNIGTKAAVHYHWQLQGGESRTLKFRLVEASVELANPFADYDDIFCERRQEADAFYAPIVAHMQDSVASVTRQALAGMLWSKQYYWFECHKWLKEHTADPFVLNSRFCRNKEWFHMINDHIISVPDKWEYPWYAAWDLAFHTMTYSLVDLDFAKQQLLLMLKEIYQHPNGQIPAYEWDFSGVNPPVHAWAALYINNFHKALYQKSDTDFLKKAFSKLLINFTWWVNRKDRCGKNIFEGGFLGLDNIGVFDRSAPLPDGGYLEQADGTAWMAFFCQNMLELSMELAGEDPSYEDLTLKFSEHFLWIAAAVNKVGDEGMWDEQDGFYYDILRKPDGQAERLKVRSFVGLLPLCASTVIEQWQRENVPKAMKHLMERAKQMPDLILHIHPTGTGHLGVAQRGISALVNEHKLKRILSIMLDEAEFLSPYGIRSLSKYHEKNPYVIHLEGKEHVVNYLPAESDSRMFGGNSNWRGPIWLPINILVIRALLNYYLYYGNRFQVECPTGSGKWMNLFEAAKEIANRVRGLFLPDAEGRRPLNGTQAVFQEDPNWKDLIVFYEYFNGENGAGLGASHQTGWTGLIANMLAIFGRLDGEQYLEMGKKGLHQAFLKASD